MAKRKAFFNKRQIQYIVHLYVERELSSPEIAKLLNCSQSTVRRYLHMEGVEVKRGRINAEARKRLEHMEYLYNALGYNYAEIGAEYDITEEAVSDLFRRHNIPRRTTGETRSLKARQRQRARDLDEQRKLEQKRISA